MQQRPTDLNARRKRLRLTVKGLATLAGIDRATAHRVLRGQGAHLASTLAKLESALVEEERRIVGGVLFDLSKDARPLEVCS